MSTEEDFTIDRDGRVATITINRPQALNALTTSLMEDIVDEASDLDRDPGVGCFVVAGAGRAFAAGADITEMKGMSHVDAMVTNYLAQWETFANLRTPKIAAVGGYALGGGCELAMMCDFIIADEGAKFGQPEIKLGLIPGMGGTQRLTRRVGKALAMDMVLTGRMIDAEEALRAGLVARLVPAGQALAEAQGAAHTIASYAKAVTMVARESVAQAEQTGLDQGLAFERRNYHALFGTPAAVEGIGAFLDKREPSFNRD